MLKPLVILIVISVLKTDATNSDYHYYGGLRSFYMAGWTYYCFEGPDTPNVSIAGLFSCNHCYNFEPAANFTNHTEQLGSPAAELENQICCLYLYKC